MDLEDETELRSRIREIDNICLLEKINLLMDKLNLHSQEQALQLLERYKNTWTFTSNVSKSGDSFMVTLPKKKARELGIDKGTPTLVSVKVLRFHE